MVYPHRLTKDKKGNSYENDHLFYRSARNVTNLEYQNYLPLVEPGYINLNPRDALMNSRDCAKTKLVLSSKKNKKRREKFHMPYLWIRIGPLFMFQCQSSKNYR